LAADFLADFEVGGGGVPSIFRKASSKPSPCVVIGGVFTLLATNLALFFPHQQQEVKI
jgi:hypothetical protein